MVTSISPKPRVGYLGPPSSYTHQAAVDSFNIQQYELEAQLSIQDVFVAVQNSTVSYGVVPFENSSNGPVSDTVDNLIDHEKNCQDIVVCSEIYMDVRHCLLGNPTVPQERDILSPNSSSGLETSTMGMPDTRRPRLEDLKHITDIYSHPQALGQCRGFLATHMRTAEQHETSSTSKAAELVAEKGLKTSAAISSRLAAEVHDLTLLAVDIQDRADNTTRFLILRRRDGPDCPSRPPNNPQIPKWKALVAFSIVHEIEGALVDALYVFKTHRLNLTSINSRPSTIRPWHYIFLVEFVSTGDEDTVVKRMDAAFKDFEKATEGYKCLGYWKKHQV